MRARASSAIAPWSSLAAGTSSTGFRVAPLDLARVTTTERHGTAGSAATSIIRSSQASRRWVSLGRVNWTRPGPGAAMSRPSGMVPTILAPPSAARRRPDGSAGRPPDRPGAGSASIAAISVDTVSNEPVLQDPGAASPSPARTCASRPRLSTAADRASSMPLPTGQSSSPSEVHGRMSTTSSAGRGRLAPRRRVTKMATGS